MKNWGPDSLIIDKHPLVEDEQVLEALEWP